MRQFRTRMSAALYTFLEQAWERRHDPHVDLYKLYVGGRPHTPPGFGSDGTPDPDEYPVPPAHDAGAVDAFLAKVEGVTFPPAEIQPWGCLAELIRYGCIRRSSLRRIRKDVRALEKGSGDDAWPGLWSTVCQPDLGRSFFHFRVGGSPSLRVYLSVVPAFRTQIVDLAVRLVGVDGVSNAKVAGPLARGHDNVVVYCESQEAVDRVLDEVAHYQAGVQGRPSNAQFFATGGIQIARRVDTHGNVALVGVSTAVEPAAHPDVLEKAGISGRPSFGAFWEALVKPILLDSQDKTQFAMRVLARLNAVGIDPLRPEA